jgi:hypothetical protein
MPQQARNFPNYYDGSSHFEFAEEIADGLEVRPQEEQVSPEAWRRFIGANPFGTNRHSSE